MHCCAAGAPWGLLRGAGAHGLSADLSVLDADDLDALAEAPRRRGPGGPRPGPRRSSPPPRPEATALTERVLRLLDLLGLDLEAVTDRLVITPACGLAGATPPWARRATDLCARSPATSAPPRALALCNRPFGRLATPSGAVCRAPTVGYTA